MPSPGKHKTVQARILSYAQDIGWTYVPLCKLPDQMDTVKGELRASLSVRPMRNKWASCSLQGNLNFNAELVALDREIGDYVIVHELLHFFVPNHGKLWKSLMRVHLGDYEQVKERLARRGFTPPSALPSPSSVLRSSCINRT